MNNEIHGDILPRFFRRLKWHDGSKWEVMARLGNLALRARASEFQNITFEVVASEMSLNIGVEFVKPRVTSKWCIMDFTE